MHIYINVIIYPMLIIIIIYKLKVNKINENLFKTTKYM
jgi:hypothetical protein